MPNINFHNLALSKRFYCAVDLKSWPVTRKICDIFQIDFSAGMFLLLSLVIILVL